MPFLFMKRGQLAYDYQAPAVLENHGECIPITQVSMLSQGAPRRDSCKRISQLEKASGPATITEMTHMPEGFIKKCVLVGS